jgi:hypothetical protein
MNASDTTCGNQTGTLLKQAVTPRTFAVRAGQAGGRIPTRTAPPVVNASQEAIKLLFLAQARTRHGPGPLQTMTSP